jgi:hypothetical protein
VSKDACFICETDSNPRKLAGEQYCQRCPDVLVSRLSGPKLLEHMGAHILHDSHIKDADNPCGLCLNTGSHFVFVKSPIPFRPRLNNTSVYWLNSKVHPGVMAVKGEKELCK